MKNSQFLVEFPCKYYYNIFYKYFIIGVLQNQYGFSVDNIYVKYKCLLHDNNIYIKKSLYDFYLEQLYYNIEKSYSSQVHHLQDSLILFTDNEKFILFNLMNTRYLTFLNIKNYIDPFIYEDILKHPNKIINKRYLKNHVFLDVNKKLLKVHEFLQLGYYHSSYFDIIYSDIINNLSIQEINSTKKLFKRLFNCNNNFLNYTKELDSDDDYLYDLYLGNLVKSQEDNKRFILFLNMKRLIIQNLNNIPLIKNYVDNMCIDCMLDGYTVNRFNRNHLLKHIYELNYTRESMAQLIYKIKYLYPTLLNENLPRNKKATVSYIINVLDNERYNFNISPIPLNILAENILYSLFKDNPDDIFNYDNIRK